MKRLPSRQLRLAAAIIVVLVGSLLVMHYSPSQSANQLANSTVLQVGQAATDVGSVWADPNFAMQLPIENTTKDPVEIVAFQKSCGCTQVEPNQLSIPPHSKSHVLVKINLTAPTFTHDAAQSNLSVNGQLQSVAKSTYPFDVTIRARVKLPSGKLSVQQPWTIRGKVRSAFIPRPSAVSFGHTLLKARQADERTVDIAATIPLKSFTATCDPTKADLQIQPDVNGLHYLVRIRTKESLPLGPFSFPVYLMATTQEGQSLPVIHVPVEGVVLDDIQAVPTSLNFGAASVGRDGTESVVLHSLSNEPFDVISVTSSNSNLSARVLRRSDLTVEYRVAERFTAFGERRDHLQFVVRRAGKEARTSTIVVPCSYLGITQ